MKKEKVDKYKTKLENKRLTGEDIDMLEDSKYEDNLTKNKYKSKNKNLIKKEIKIKYYDNYEKDNMDIPDNY